MFKSTQDVLKKFTARCRDFIADAKRVEMELSMAETTASEQEIDIYDSRMYDLFLTNYPLFKNELTESMHDAISSNKEYSRLYIYRDALQSAFDFGWIRDILEPYLLYGDIGRSFYTAEKTLGDFNDFYEGVLYARAVLEEGDVDEVDEDAGDGEDDDDEKPLKERKNQSPEQRAAYWRNKVWTNPEMYERTINLRFEKWNADSERGRAPFWVLLENGNIGLDYAFPQFHGTHFLWAGLIRAKKIFDSILASEGELKQGEPEQTNYQEVIVEIMNEAVRDFLQNPDSYTPGTILQKFIDIKNQREYVFYVTKTKRLGKKLAK